MPEKTSDLIQGTLDMLILKTLALEPMHGYGISVRIEQISNGVFKPNAGSLFSALNATPRSTPNGNPPKTTAARSITRLLKKGERDSTTKPANGAGR